MLIFLGDITWTLVLLVVCFFLANLSVLFFRKKYPEENTYKYIPAIASFIIFVYSMLIIFFQVEPFVSNILLLILNVLSAAMTFYTCIFSFIIAGFYDYRRLKQKNVKEGEQ